MFEAKKKAAPQYILHYSWSCSCSHSNLHRVKWNFYAKRTTLYCFSGDSGFLRVATSRNFSPFFVATTLCYFPVTSGFCVLYNQPINQPITHSITHSINQSIEKSINQSINQSFNQSINQPTNQSTNQSVNQSIKSSTNQPINWSINQSITFETILVYMAWIVCAGLELVKYITHQYMPYETSCRYLYFT